ncbi:Acetyltransferase (isoleucine patch superfamily) [Arthrobacter sp. 49Tsu3.1M3]|uniref:CatB-related O-acetyltransferase n=1 Tax=Arthrobacter sp. 49Tsu3.1M3 TaxID=1279029 RepID=UPI0009C88A87|nr:CatB-related O-acetyltransferase [Arthrobacter sp. 49Tsu3.1M3]SKB82103.1 Acetyltransferase (isoleucine patch superfamily) [Arthrobacter sp. 49Tsu3.1M3]
MPSTTVDDSLPAPSLVETELTQGIWAFRTNERVLSPALRFLPDGRILGYSHRYENSWRAQGDALLFLDTNGRVTSRLDRTSASDVAVVFEGKSLINSSITFTVSSVSWEDRGRWAQLTQTTMADHIAKFDWDIGDHTYGRPVIFESSAAHLSIGRFCSIAAGVEIALGNHRIDTVSSYPFSVLSKWWPSAAGMKDHDSRGAVTIGSDVWVGASAFITSGVTIGHGAVIAAHTVVTKDVPPYAIVGGNPGKVIKFRFPPETIEKLLKIAWWNWTDEHIDAHLPLMFGPNIEDFISAAQSHLDNLRQRSVDCS